MKITVKFFAYLPQLFRNSTDNVELPSGSNVGDLLNRLCDAHGCREQIFEGDKLRLQMIVLKNGQHINHLSGLETKLDDGDTIVLIPPVGGG